MKKILIFIVKVYQYLVSPLLGNKCRFLPTCSEYFIEALEKHGLIKGLALGIKRISRCHPFRKLGGSQGIDFVPIPKNASREVRRDKIVEGLKKAGWKFIDNKKGENG